MSYFSAMVAAVPKDAKEAYIDHEAASWPLFAKAGALRQVAIWGEDVMHGQQTDFWRAVDASDDEIVACSWIEWPDRATADAAWGSLSPEAMPPMPFDGKRLIFGGFTPLYRAGTDRGGYYQAFITPVPTANRDAYAKLADHVYETMFAPNGCLGTVEAWAEDVPRGSATDFWRAVDAREGEEVVFAWTAWPDRATCDAAAEAMGAASSDEPHPEMPFDGMRMVWGGFVPVFDETA
ncbi:MAG: DUF1428 domain-containing protein [Paracoccus sp. (in: a-proteobacteria)]|nr:DUF1428 domain-containing protein [Paracoccus sp. (in: a-proteobacteria)]